MHVHVKRSLLGWCVIAYRATTGRYGVSWAHSGAERSGICLVAFGHGLLLTRTPQAIRARNRLNQREA